jgi:hypothetical protein
MDYVDAVHALSEEVRYSLEDCGSSNRARLTKGKIISLQPDLSTSLLFFLKVKHPFDKFQTPRRMWIMALVLYISKTNGSELW